MPSQNCCLGLCTPTPIHSLMKYLLSTCWTLGTVLGAGEYKRGQNQTGFSPLQSSQVRGRETDIVITQ